MQHLRVIKPGKKPYIIFLLLFSPIIGLYIYISIAISTSGLQGLIILIAIILCFHVWIFSQTIEIFPDRISHHFLFFWKRTIYLKDIEKWSLQIGVFKYLDRFKPTVRIEIHPTGKDKSKAIVIPRKLFRKTDIEYILNWLPSEKESH